MRHLPEMTAELQGLAVSGDKEIAHGRADDILIEAILRLDEMPNYYTPDEVSDLITAWRAVPKWYA